MPLIFKVILGVVAILLLCDILVTTDRDRRREIKYIENFKCGNHYVNILDNGNEFEIVNHSTNCPGCKNTSIIMEYVDRNK